MQDENDTNGRYGDWGLPYVSILIAVIIAVVLFNLDLESDAFFLYWQGGENNTSRSEVFRNFVLLIVAFVGLGFAIWRTRIANKQAASASKQADISEHGLFTDRFSKAVEQLGNPQLPIRLGGIYALWRLAEDSVLRDKKSVWDILCAFVRDPPHAGELRTETEKAGTLRTDIEAILILFGHEKAARDRDNAKYEVDLTSAYLQYAGLSGLTLNGVNLIAADLSRARLIGTDLSQAYLAVAKLSKANLHLAILSGANLSNTVLIDANLSKADLASAKELTQDQLDLACQNEGREPPKLPEGLIWHGRICE